MFSKDVPVNAAAKVTEAPKINPQIEPPAAANPAKPAKSAQNPANPTKPANPAQNPVKPGEPGDKGKPDADKELKDKTKPDADKDLKDKTRPDDAGKDAEDKRDRKDKTDKESKDKKDKPGKDGKSGGGKGGLSLPSAPTPPGGAALAPAAGALAGGIIGGLFPGGKKEAEKEEKKVKGPKPAPKEAAASTETAKAAEPVKASTQAAAPEPLFSAGPGPKIAVVDFDGEAGAEFAALLSTALSADLKVYNPKELAAREFDTAALNRVSARKIAAKLEVEYIVTGKVNKKSETLSIISVYLRDARTGDIRLTNNQNVRSAGELPTAAENAAEKITERANSK